ncbi:MAG: hypothetical protein KIT86_06425 [Hydrogenophaga sp.]|uniref:hypothetical protein n=1 Tax=Hydrogenophaga sp. TaxID=1904254 RepID=UPI002615E4A0|nr:hypothetical protein [Hydrogenophaga sp.]MCW5669279.1 hypothetical protein [Hydrogenophaga sp.]
MPSPPSAPSSSPADAAAAGSARTPITDARQAALQPILDLARPAAALLPVDSAPDAFSRELQRQAAP